MSSISNKQVPVEMARELKNNWDKNQAEAIEKQLGFKDVRDFLFDLEDLREYLELVKRKSEEQGIKRPGIRLYFGAYSSDQRATVFLAPTQEIDGTEKEEDIPDNYDIDPLNTVHGGFPPRIY